MGRPALEVADLFRAYGPAWRQAQAAHLSRSQLKVMSAIEQCRRSALGGHVLRCSGCNNLDISYHSCRNRHCPKCQARAAQRWLEARQADLLPVEYYHVVFTVPAPLSAIAYTNKAAIYRLLFDVAAQTLLTIAADRRHLGAQIGATLVLHTWGSAMTHHPHVHGIVPSGGTVPGWRPLGSVPARILPAGARALAFVPPPFHRGTGEIAPCRSAALLRRARVPAEPAAFARWLAPLRSCESVVYAKRPFAGPQAVLAYLSRYTHRVAISNRRLVSMGERGVSFRWKIPAPRGAPATRR